MSRRARSTSPASDDRAARHGAAGGRAVRDRGRARARPAASACRRRAVRAGAGAAVLRVRRPRRRALADRRLDRRGAAAGPADACAHAGGRGVRAGARRAAALAALAVLGAALVWAVTGLPDFGRPQGAYATEAVRATVSERHVTNTVVGVTFDLRGIDTLGEELILFCAAIGSTVLLRSQREEGRVEEAARAADAARPGIPASLRLSGALLIGPVLMFGTYVVAHGHLSPGGGFQGGVILAAALLLVYAAGRLLALERVRPVALVEAADALGAAAFALVAVGGLVFGVAAMANFLPLGSLGSLLSGGTIPVLSVAVGVEVAGAVTL